MEMTRKNMKSIIEDMELDYPLYTEGDYSKYKPDSYEHGIYKYVPNKYWGLWTQMKPYWRKHATENPNGIGIYEAFTDIWNNIEEELGEDMDEVYSINKVLTKKRKSDIISNGELFCKYTPKYLEESLQKDNGLNEIIYNEPTKLFVDIDVKCDNNLPNKVLHQYYNEAIEQVKIQFSKLVNYGKQKRIDPEFIMSEAIGVNADNIYKYSSHMILRGYYISPDNRILLGNYLNVSLPESVNMYVDKCVYEKKRKLKLPNQLKLDDKQKGLTDRAQRIQEGTNIMDYVLQNITGCKSLDKSLDAMSKKLKIKGRKLIREMRVKPVSDRPTPRVDSLTRLSPIHILNLFDTRPKHMCKEFHKRVMMWSMSNGVSFEEWYGVFSDYWRNQYLPHNRKDGRNKCYNEDYTYRRIWRNQWNKLQDLNIPIKMEWIMKALKAQYPDFYEEDYKKFNEAIIDADNIEGEWKEYYTIFKPTKENPHLPVEMIKKVKKKYILLSTGLGQGKTWDTQILTREIINRNRFGKVLYICNRIALKEDILGKFIDTSKFNLGDETYDYKDIKSGKKTLPSYNYVLLTTLESLPQFQHTGYDLVVVDECEAVNMTFLTDSMKSTLPGNRYEQVVNAYGRLLTTSKKIIMCDGLLMTRTMRFIDDIEGMTGSKSYHLYHTIVSDNKNLQDRSIIYYRDDPKCSAHYRFMNDLLDYILDGKKVYLFMPHLTGKSSPLKISRDKGNDVEGQGVLLLKNYFMEYCKLSDDDIRLHYGNSSNNKKLQDVNAYWKNGKLVLSTSCITNGVSYDNKDEIYDSVWLLTDSSFISARDTAQISARMRYLTDYKIRVCDLTNGANPTMFNRPNYVSKPLFKDVVNKSSISRKGEWNDEKSVFNRYFEADINKWRIKDPNKMKHKTGSKLYWRWAGIINAIREKNIITYLHQWDKRKKQRYEIAIKNLHGELRREHYVRGSSVLIRMFKKLGIEVSEIIEPHKGDEAKAKKKFNDIGIDVSRINAVWEYDNIDVLDNNVLYEQYRFQNKRGLLGNTERYELQKRNFLNQFKDDTPEDVLRDMFDTKVFKGFKALINGHSYLPLIFNISEGVDWKGQLTKEVISLKKNLKKKSALLRRGLDFGGMTNHKKMIRKVMNYYFSKRYVEAEVKEEDNIDKSKYECEFNEDGTMKEGSGKWIRGIDKVRTGNDILTEEFYKDLNTFIKWFDFENPLTFDNRDYPLYLPFTTRVLYKGGGSDIINPEDLGGIDQNRAESLSINYWMDDDIKIVPYDMEIVSKVCAMNPYIEYKKKLKCMYKILEGMEGVERYNMERKIDNELGKEWSIKYKWKVEANGKWIMID